MCVEEFDGHMDNCRYKNHLCYLGCGEMIECLDMSEHLLTDCPKQLIPCPNPSKCKCNKDYFKRAHSNALRFFYHDQTIIDMKRRGDLLELRLNAVVRIVYQS